MKPIHLIGLIASIALGLAACERHRGPQPTAAFAAEPEPAGDHQPPADWHGVGVLAKRSDAPNEAPVWASIRAEVVDRGGQRYLRATGKAEDIDNPALGRSTAENRARAEMARWLHTQAISGAQVVDSYSAAPQVYLVLVEIAVPQEILGPKQ